MSIDKWGINRAEQPAIEAFEVTPSDTEDLQYTSRSIYVGSEGDLVVDMYGPTGGASAFSGGVATNPQTVKFKNVQAGSVLPICVRRVREEGTTASGIVALL